MPNTLQTVNDTAYKYMFRSPITALSNQLIQFLTISVLICLFVLYFELRSLYFCNPFMYLEPCFEHWCMCVKTLRSYFFCRE